MGAVGLLQRKVFRALGDATRAGTGDRAAMSLCPDVDTHYRDCAGAFTRLFAFLKQLESPRCAIEGHGGKGDDFPWERQLVLLRSGIWQQSRSG